MSPPDAVLDLTGVPCPTNSAKALIRLEMMDPGEVLEVTVDDGEPIANVPPSLEEEGHTVLHRHRLGDGRWVLRVKAR